MEYASPIWGGAGSTSLNILDRIQRKAMRILKIDDPIDAGIHSLQHRRDVSTLSVFYRHMFLQPSVELSSIMPPGIQRTRVTRSSVGGHQHSLAVPRSRTSLHMSSYIPRATRLWNALPDLVFPDTTNPHIFKLGVNRFLCDIS